MMICPTSPRCVGSEREPSWRGFLSESRSKSLHGMAVPMPSDPKWFMDLAFLVDITSELNLLNKKLQGQRLLITTAYDNVKAFSTKWSFMESPALSTNRCRFLALKALMDAGWPLHGEKYADGIVKLLEEFDHRFVDFKTHRDKSSMSKMAMLCFKWSSLNCSAILNSKPSSGRWVEKQTSLDILWQSPPTFPELSRDVQADLVHFTEHISVWKDLLHHEFQ